jgi:uncharacterized protein DUF4202
MSARLEKAKRQAAAIIKRSEVSSDLPHAENVRHWLMVLQPDADDVLQFAAYAHDVERGMPDRLRVDMFDGYDEYKAAHAKRAGEIAAGIAREAGFSGADCERLARIIEGAEFPSGDPEIQLVCDADSISFFDTNVAYYLDAHGTDALGKKARFMYDRASERAKEHIRTLAGAKPVLAAALDLP